MKLVTRFSHAVAFLSHPTGWSAHAVPSLEWINGTVSTVGESYRFRRPDQMLLLHVDGADSTAGNGWLSAAARCVNTVGVLCHPLNPFDSPDATPVSDSWPATSPLIANTDTNIASVRCGSHVAASVAFDAADLKCSVTPLPHEPNVRCSHEHLQPQCNGTHAGAKSKPDEPKAAVDRNRLRTRRVAIARRRVLSFGIHIRSLQLAVSAASTETGPWP